MSSPRRGRSTRDRPAKAPLGADVIADAAVMVLRSEGLEAMSLRRVAAALDTTASSVYVYFDGREGLLRAVLDRVMATIRLETPDPEHWRTQLGSVLRHTRQALIEHPGIAAAAMIDPPRTPAVLRLLENLLGLLLAGGLDAQSAAWTADVLTALVTHAAIEGELRRTDAVDLPGAVEENFARLPAAEFPLITAHAAELTAGDVDTRFRFAVDAVIEGVLHRRTPEPRT